MKEEAIFQTLQDYLLLMQKNLPNSLSNANWIICDLLFNIYTNLRKNEIRFGRCVQVYTSTFSNWTINCHPSKSHHYFDFFVIRLIH